MARRRKGRPVNGWLVLDKPAGMTAAQAVAKAKWAFQAQKAGHAGTLDPLATGVLPIALGEATKTVPYVMDGPKEYRFTVRWGVATETDDTEGAVAETSDARPTAAEIRAVLPRFTGEIMQRPPAYSAIKVGGERAYDLARDGAPPELAERPVFVERIDLVETPDADRAVFEIRCGKGTYVRSLARDLARALGTVGHVEMLRRTAAGPFAESDAISLEKLETLRHSPPESGEAPDFLLSVEAALDDIPALALTESEAGRLRNGQPVPVLRTENRECIAPLDDGDMLRALSGGRLVALTRLEGRQVHPVRVFNL